MGARRVLTAGRGAAIAACAGALALGACGGEDFANDPRPPAPVELSALVTDDDVEVGPRQIGAGLVNVTVTNQSAGPARLTFEGPSDEATREIPAGGVGTIKLELEEGDYEVRTGEAAVSADTIATLNVGPERKSSQNDLLLP